MYMYHTRWRVYIAWTSETKIPKTDLVPTPFSKSWTWSLSSKMFAFCDRSSHGVENYFVADCAEIFFIRQTLISGAVLLPWWRQAGDIDGEWWPQISGLSTRCLPCGLQLINFLREILGLWIKTWRQNKVKCQTGFCIGFNYLALSLTWNNSERFYTVSLLQIWIFFHILSWE